MLVEDDPGTREVFGIALEMEGFVVIAFGTAREALERIPIVRPAAVIADLKLDDGMGGAALVRALRAMSELSELRHFAVTGTHPDLLPNEERALFDRVFLKPIDIDVVASAIRGSTDGAAAPVR